MVEGETWVEDLPRDKHPSPLFLSSACLLGSVKCFCRRPPGRGETQGGVSSGPEYPQVLITILHPQPSDLSPAKLRGPRWGGGEAEERAVK